MNAGVRQPGDQERSGIGDTRTSPSPSSTRLANRQYDWVALREGIRSSATFL